MAVPKNSRHAEPVQYGRATLKSREKLVLGSEFAYVRKSGRKYVGNFFLLVAADSTDGALRFGIICGRKFSRKAVARNRARRLLRESFRLLKGNIKPCHMVLIARKRMISCTLQEIQKEMETLAGKAELWEDRFPPR